jgi:homoserine kinase type II
MLWFERERPEGEEDTELFIGVYSSESTAKAAIERLKQQRGFVEFPEGFHIYPYEIDKDHWREGYILD